MLDINLIRNNPELVKNGIAKKNINSKIVDDFLILDDEWRKITKESEDLRAEQKKLGAERKIEKAKELKNKIQILESDLKLLEIRRDELLSLLPNLPFEDVPIGKDESENKVLRQIGKKPDFPAEYGFEPKDYLEIGQNLNLIDTERAAKVSGSRFGYLKGQAALLEFALIKLAFDTLIPEGFIPIIPPVMIKPESYREIGRLAAGQEEERYYLQKDNLYLVGSSEHSIGPMHKDEIFEERDLPKKYLGFSTCFRREAGSYGKDTRGILRVHQFDKVEMFSFVKPEDSEKELKYLLSLQEKLMQKLELPYQIVEICTGDMGWTDNRQYDVEVWIPAQKKYRETNSASNTGDFQTRGINCRYRKESGQKIEFAHALNATAFAIGRMIIAIIENYQTKEGTILVPKVLQDYLGTTEIK
ncbi:MAG: serine--tRNA ligase [Patescibacteria group bacterium]